MRSLFFRIFFGFWATAVATGVALILTFIIEPRSVPSRWHETLTETARYSGTIAVETGGTGLGLAIADRVVRLHGGTIRAGNAAPRGLRIEIILPQASGVPESV